MKKLGLILIALGVSAFAFNTLAAEKPSKTKKPETTVEAVHPERDHTVEADDVNVKREKTVYAGSSNHSMNFVFQPLPLLLGIVNFDLDFKLSKSMTLGPSLMYWDSDFLSTHIRAYSLGIRANFYPGGEALDSDGLYVGPSINYMSMKAEKNNLSAEIKGTVFTTVAGYQWIWDSFNIMLGGGFTISNFPDKVTVKNTTSNSQEEVSVGVASTGLALEFGLGFAF